MIRGLGIDLLAVERFAALKDKEGFSRNVFTPAETGLIDRAPEGARYQALLFTLKEAVLKAVGCGLGSGSFWRSVEAGADGDGSVKTSGRAGQLAAAKAVTRIHNSAACTREQALCVVLLESDQ